MSHDLECPYCGHGFDVDDPYDISIGGKNNETECEKCKKRFVFTAEADVSYYCEKADCLNGEPHKWVLRRSAPREYSKMICRNCDELREMTADEWGELMEGKNV